MAVRFDALKLLREATERHGIHLSDLVAETSLWVNPEVHRRLQAEGEHAVFFPRVRRYRAGAGERRAEIRAGERLDDNSYANNALKRALGLPHGTAVGFEVCHIWPASCYDARCHTAVANLVLVPRPLAGLSDHDPEIQAALKYRSFELYAWAPPGEPVPERPAYYPGGWREPEPFTETVARSLAARRPSHLSDLDPAEA